MTTKNVLTHAKTHAKTWAKITLPKHVLLDALLEFMAVIGYTLAVIVILSALLGYIHQDSPEQLNHSPIAEFFADVFKGNAHDAAADNDNADKVQAANTKTPKPPPATAAPPAINLQAKH